MTSTDDRDPPALRVQLLGPLRLLVDGEPVEVPGGRRRSLLALLALARGRAVSLDQLVAALWPDKPPDKERQAVQSLVSRLRAHLGPHADRLVHQGGGYCLPLAGAELDVAEVEELAAEARLVAPTDPNAAAALLDRARGRWRGDALAEFADVDALTPDALALAELRLRLEEEHLAALLDGQAPGDHVAAATTLATAQPGREARQLLLMRALAAAGRTAEALRVAHEHRTRLSEESGLDPSPSLAELESRIASGVEAARDPRLPSPAPSPPRFRSRLVGRVEEAAELRRLLDAEHLVTVLGPPGVGKTRLVAEVAATVAGEGGCEVSYVALAEVGATASLSSVLAGELGVLVGPDQTPLAAAAERLAAGPHLLVLDNCEHVLGAARDLCSELLARCPALTLLLTSRVPTGLPEEWVLRLPPLGTTGEAAHAVELFVDRARRVRPQLVLDDEQRAAVQEVVTRLDGLPLAIELAAGRLSTLSLGDLSRRLDGALDLLRDPGPAGQHRTLRDAVQWSYDLLDDAQQRLLRHLAVFPGGLDLEGVERVAGEVGLAMGGDVELGALVDASLVDADLDEAPRYRLLETVRALALDAQRQVPGEGEAAQSALLAWAVDAATTINQLVAGPDESEGDRRLRREVANLRAAHHLALERGDLDTAIALTAALDEPAAVRDLPEIWTWALRLVDWPDVEPHPRRLELLGAAAQAAWVQGDLVRSRALAEAGLALDPAHPRSLHCLATVHLFGGDHGRAAELWLQASESDVWHMASAALACAYSGDTDRAWALQHEVVRLLTDRGGLSKLAFAHYAGAELGPPDAEARYEQAVQLARQAGATFVEGVARVGLAALWARTGRDDEALAAFEELVRHWRRSGSWTQQWTTLRNLAHLLERLGEEEVAGVLVASASASPEASAAPDQAPDAPALPRGEAVRLALDAITRLRTR